MSAQNSITANLSSPESVEEAKLAALMAKKSLRNWSGEVIEKELARRRKALGAGPRLKK